jgi:hypothetical protein
MAKKGLASVPDKDEGVFAGVGPWVLKPIRDCFYPNLLTSTRLNENS